MARLRSSTEGRSTYERYYDALPEKYRKQVEKVEKEKKGTSLFKRITYG